LRGRNLPYHLHRVLDTYGRALIRELNDVRALQVLAPLQGGYVPWSTIGLRPAALVGVLNEVALHERRRIVECGGGISTLFLGRLLRQVGGHLTTIEHDERWAQQLVRQIEQERLAEQVQVIRAPLVSLQTGIDGAITQWYEPDALEGLRRGSQVDLLLVDGPPAWSWQLRHARYPAVPFFRDRLADDFAVALDDINRLGEQQILARWEQDLGIQFERRFAQGRIAIGRTQRSFHV
jgi:hypothetical protein